MYKILANSLFVGKKLHFLTSCHSTNESASDLTKSGQISEGDVVITDRQTNGKGQRGNTWEAEPGKNLTFSLVLKPTFLLASRQFELNMAISIGILNYLETHVRGFCVKWPNDIYHGEQKVCGILIQNSIKSNYLDHTIVGVGMNINQKGFDEAKAISLAQVLNKEFELNHELGGLLLQIEAAYMKLRNGAGKSIKDQYLQRMLGYCDDRLFRVGEEVFKGRITGVTAEGKLEMESSKGLLHFGFKEVEFL